MNRMISFRTEICKLSTDDILGFAKHKGKPAKTVEEVPVFDFAEKI